MVKQDRCYESGSGKKSTSRNTEFARR